MDPFEYNDIPESEQPSAPPPVSEEIPVPPQQEPPQQNYGPYHGTGAGRRESPYANSPYVQQQPYQQYQYQPQTQPPQKPKKAPKNRKPFWKALLAVVLVIALVASGCGITAWCVRESWEERTEHMED